MDILIVSAWIIIISAIISTGGFFYRQYKKLIDNILEIQTLVQSFNINPLSRLNEKIFQKKPLKNQSLQDLIKLYETRGEDIKKASIWAYAELQIILNMNKSIKRWNKLFFWVKDNGGVKITKKSIEWSDKDRLILNVSLIIGISSGLISGTLVATISELTRNPNMTNAINYLITWVVVSIILIFTVHKVNKYKKMMK